jgi:hypothetical protein
VTTVSVLLGRGDGTFRARTTYPSLHAAAGVLVDLNRDGKLDVVTANTLNSVSVFLGNGNGTLRSPVNYPVGVDQNSVQGIAAGDINTDGRPDVVTANGFDYSVSTLRSRLDRRELRVCRCDRRSEPGRAG